MFFEGFMILNFLFVRQFRIFKGSKFDRKIGGINNFLKIVIKVDFLARNNILIG